MVKNMYFRKIPLVNHWMRPYCYWLRRCIIKQCLSDLKYIPSMFKLLTALRMGVCPRTFHFVWLFVVLWTVAHQAPLFTGFSRQEYWSGLPCSPPGNLPHPRIDPGSLMSPELAGRFFFFFPFIFISWRVITLQYCSGFCHTLTWISHGFTCIPHPDPPSHLPLHPIPLGLPRAPAPSTCLMHPTWAGDLFHYR